MGIEPDQRFLIRRVRVLWDPSPILSTFYYQIWHFDSVTWRFSFIYLSHFDAKTSLEASTLPAISSQQLFSILLNHDVRCQLIVMISATAVMLLMTKREMDLATRYPWKTYLAPSRDHFVSECHKLCSHFAICAFCHVDSLQCCQLALMHECAWTMRRLLDAFFTCPFLRL